MAAKMSPQDAGWYDKLDEDEAREVMDLENIIRALDSARETAAERRNVIQRRATMRGRKKNKPSWSMDERVLHRGI